MKTKVTVSVTFEVELDSNLVVDNYVDALISRNLTPSDEELGNKLALARADLNEQIESLGLPKGTKDNLTNYVVKGIWGEPGVRELLIAKVNSLLGQ